MDQVVWSKEKLQGLREEERLKMRRQNIVRATNDVIQNILYSAKKGDMRYEWNPKVSGTSPDLVDEIADQIRPMFPDSKISVDDKKIIVIDWS